MSDELKSQSIQASVPVQQQEQQQQQQSGTGFEQTPSPQHQHQHHHQPQHHPYHYHGGNNTYSQRGGRNGHHNNNRQGQQRGGRFGSNKYNSHSNNSGQYNRYNNGVGNGNRNYNGGYKSHRNSMNPAAAAAMNMQWPGYYNSPPIYYVPPQLVPPTNAAATAGATPPAATSAGATPGPAALSADVSSSSSPNSSVSGASTPQPKKIEITTKTGQHLDLNVLHSQHSGNTTSSNSSSNNSTTVNSNNDNTSNNDNANSNDNGEFSNTSNNTPQPTAKKDENSSHEKGAGNEDPERTKREFLEQIRLRKQAMEKKKQEEALKKHEQENKANQSESAPAPVSPASVTQESNATAQVSSEDKPEKISNQEHGTSGETAVVTEKSEVAEPVTADPVPNPADVTAASAGGDGSNEAAATNTESVEQQENAEAEQPKGGTYAAKLAVIKQQKAQEAAAKAESENKDHKTEELPKGEGQPKEKTEDSEEQQTVEASQPEVKESTQAPASSVAPSSSELPSEKPASEQTNAELASGAAEEAASASVAPATTGVDEKKESGPDDYTVGTMSQLLEKLKNAAPIEDVYSFDYPETVERPDPKYKSSHRRFTYGPTFLLQFKDKVKAKPDEEWAQHSISKIVITPAMMKMGKPRDAGGFGGGPGGRGGDFRKSGSLRNMEGRSNSRSSSKKKSKRMMDDRKSNRPYTSRKDREKSEKEAEEQKKEEEKQKQEVKPLIPSANRWVPKSKIKKAEKKLAPDGVTEMVDKEEAERRMKSLLNKLTLEMFDQISSQILQIADQSKWEKQGETLKVVIEQVFHKACDEPHWSSMYAQLCGKVVKELNPEIGDETNEGKKGPKLVLHYLVARCHEEFDKGWTDKLPTKEDGSPLEPEMMSDEYYKLAAAKRRGLGLVRFIGYLYRLNLLTGKMMFECFRRLMKDLSNAPSEETLESVVELLNTVGEQFETDSFSAGQATLEGSALLDSLFATLQDIINESKVSSRMKFKLIDIRELREERNWDSEKKQDGPKTIQQIHEEEKERQMRNSSSRSNSRRVNNSMGGRSSSRRDAPSMSKDSFVSTRAASLRHPQKSTQKEEPRKPEKSATNMFSALMDSNEDE